MLRIAPVVVLVSLRESQGFLRHDPQQHFDLLPQPAPALKVTGLHLQWGKWIFSSCPGHGCLRRFCLAPPSSTSERVSPLLSLLVGIPLASLGYGFLLLLMGCVTREDARMVRGSLNRGWLETIPPVFADKIIVLTRSWIHPMSRSRCFGTNMNQYFLSQLLSE